MDFHVITSRDSELIVQVIDGEVIIVPPPEPASSEASSQGQIQGQ